MYNIVSSDMGECIVHFEVHRGTGDVEDTRNIIIFLRIYNSTCLESLSETWNAERMLILVLNPSILEIS
jgi:hypothetical protein